MIIFSHIFLLFCLWGCSTFSTQVSPFLPSHILLTVYLVQISGHIFGLFLSADFFNPIGGYTVADSSVALWDLLLHVDRNKHTSVKHLQKLLKMLPKHATNTVTDAVLRASSCCAPPSARLIESFIFLESLVFCLAFWQLSVPPTSIKEVKRVGFVHRCSIQDSETASAISVIWGENAHICSGDGSFV